MQSLASAVKGRFVYKHVSFYGDRMHFTLRDAGLQKRCQAILDRHLKMAKKIERDEFFFWVKELTRKNVSYRQAVSIKQRLVRMHKRFDPEDRPDLPEELLRNAVERAAANSAKVALRNMRTHASKGANMEFNDAKCMIRGLFRSSREAVTRATGMSLKQMEKTIDKYDSIRRSVQRKRRATI